MRGAVTGLRSRVPLATLLPGVLREDDLMVRLVSAFDDALAPVLLTLDGLQHYVDPRVTPDDFLDWLAAWVGLELQERWTLEQRREAVAGAARAQRLLGTPAGVRSAVEAAVDGDVEVSDSGGVVASPTPGGELPGDGVAALRVRVQVDDPDAVDPRVLDAVVRAAKPAHVPHTCEIVRRAR